MKWNVELSQSAEKFILKHGIEQDEISALVVNAIHYFQGKEVSIDIKKLKGEWKGFYRIRKGKIRIIAEFNFKYSAVFIEEIDYRGNVYK